LAGARVSLNIDLGELDDEPEELYVLADVASIACGGHAGDAGSIARALARCARGRAQPGAHPAVPDRARFGRVWRPAPPAEVRGWVRAQCALVPGVAWVKPHGALYHAADADPALAAAVVAGAIDALGRGIALIGPAGGALAAAARAEGLGFAREGFADRGMRDGKLVPRTEPGAVIEDPAAAAAQATALAAGGGVDTLCVHGDNPRAVAVARAVREALDGLGS
jgi:5-oxoprolinase (ATP-hydrolysing) subunit A